MSQRAYARHRAELGLSGGTHRAVQKALAGGRIVLVDGQIDSAAADQAWADNTSEGHRRNAAELEQAEAKASPRPVGDAPAIAAVSTPLVPRVATAEGVTLARASAIEKGFRAKIAQLDYEERTGKLVNAEEVKLGWARIVSVSRNKLLGLPSKLKERIPELTVANVQTIEAALLEALEDLANGVG